MITGGLIFLRSGHLRFDLFDLLRLENNNGKPSARGSFTLSTVVAILRLLFTNIKLLSSRCQVVIRFLD